MLGENGDGDVDGSEGDGPSVNPGQAGSKVMRGGL